MYKRKDKAILSDIHRASAHHSSREEMVGMVLYEVRYSPLEYIKTHYGDAGWLSIYYRTEDGRPGCIFGGRITDAAPTWEV
jgi:hypothetical protein